MNKHFSTVMLAAAAGLAQAHEGHGLPGPSHWHAGDVALVLAAAVVAVGLWLARRGK